MTELLTIAVALTVATWWIAWLFREAPEFDEVCFEPGCHRMATHQRPEGVTSGGTPVVVLVCRRHGRVPR